MVASWTINSSIHLFFYLSKIAQLLCDCVASLYRHLTVMHHCSPPRTRCFACKTKQLSRRLKEKGDYERKRKVYKTGLCLNKANVWQHLVEVEGKWELNKSRTVCQTLLLLFIYCCANKAFLVDSETSFPFVFIDTRNKLICFHYGLLGSTIY